MSQLTDELIIRIIGGKLDAQISVSAVCFVYVRSYNYDDSTRSLS